MSTAPINFGGFSNSGSSLPSLLSNYGPSAGGLLGGIGNMFAPPPTTTTGSSSGNFQQQGTSSLSGSSTPTYDPAADSLRRQLINSSLSNLFSDTDLSGYKAQGLDTINRGTDASKRALDATLAARGLSYAPSSVASQTQLDVGAQGQKSQFINSLPLLQQQLYQQKLQQALDVFRSNPYGTNVQQAGTTDTSGSQSQTSQQKTQTGGSGIGGLLSGVGAALALI